MTTPLKVPVLCATSVSVKGEKQQPPLLDRLSLNIKLGERVAVVGPNGSGKTTLLKTLCGLIPTESGQITIKGQALGSWSRKSLAKEISYMPQQVTAAFPLNGLELVLLGRAPHLSGLGLAGETEISMVKKIMETLEVWTLRNRPINRISGGELQRLMFAQTVVQDTPFVFLDEPTSAQDPAGVLQIMQTIERLSTQKTFFVTLHDLNLAWRFFERIIVLNEGQIACEGTPEDVLNAGILEQVFRVQFSSQNTTQEGAPTLIPQTVKRSEKKAGELSHSIIAIAPFQRTRQKQGPPGR
jgi:iron complex transport system ATP-binding protein